MRTRAQTRFRFDLNAAREVPQGCKIHPLARVHHYRAILLTGWGIDGTLAVIPFGLAPLLRTYEDKKRLQL